MHDDIAALFADPSEALIGTNIRGLTSDRFGEADVIEVAPDRATAAASLHCIVETETVIGPDCPLLQMAREQGGGVVRCIERGVLENVYIKREGKLEDPELNLSSGVALALTSSRTRPDRP